MVAARDVKLHDIARQETANLAYHRTPSASSVVWDQIVAGGALTFEMLAITPLKWRGAPGVALLDHDGDGDLDIYVTNGPGTANSLFSSQLEETGELTFRDVAQTAGVGATDQDSSGVCFGDTDNDGDHDLFVLSNFGPNRFFENRGDGSFSDLSTFSNLGNDNKSSMACSFGDVNGDGLLDIVVANSWDDMSNQFGLVIPFEFNQHNQLYLNLGDNLFADVSAASGIEDLRSFAPGFEGLPPITWAIAMVDYDLDGDMDIVQACDQAGVPRAVFGGVDLGFIFLLENDGSGHFTDVTPEKGTHEVGEWMGLSFADVDHDGHLDMFATNVGDWALTTVTPLDPVYGAGLIYNLGDSTSRWFLGGEGGVFTDPGVGELVGTPFGWGTSMADYDNDGDTDIVYHGGMGIGPVVHLDNMGVMLENDGSGHFTYDREALAESTDHQRRVVHGMAMGDLNGDGFSDIVSVSSFDVQASIPITPYRVRWGAPFDGQVGYQTTFLPTETLGSWVYSGIERNIDGSLSVEINSADNGNHWLKVEVLGTVDLLRSGRVNRDGIGATVKVTPWGGEPTLHPILGGASYASQDSLVAEVGLGSARRATVEVLWPGGARNRLYHVEAGAEILFPEIPCSFADPAPYGAYLSCVLTALRELDELEVLPQGESFHFLTSAIRAYVEHRR